MSEKSPDTLKTSRIERMKLAARKTGALAEAAVVSVTGVAAMEAAVNVSPANAGTEAAASHEAQSPAAFLKRFYVRFGETAQTMHSSPDFKSYDLKKLEKTLGGHYDSWSICEASKQYPGRYDCLGVLMLRGQPIPDSAALYLGSKVKSAEDPKDWKRGYYLATTANKGLGKWLALEEDYGPDKMDQAKNYFVSTGGYPGVNDEDFTYGKNPGAVSAAYNGFLKQMRGVIAER